MSTDVSYKVSFDDAIRNVTALDDIPLPDDVPSIQAVNNAINYQVDFDTNFCDSEAFRIAHARYPEEAKVQSQLYKILEQGRQYAIMLYTWRSCSRALPPIKSNEQPYRIQIYEKTVDILEPYVAQLREFKVFQQNAIDRLCEEVQRLCHEKKREDFVSSAYLLSLGRLLCMFAQLDEMKNMKASMKNDHSHFKRATQFLRNLDRDSMHESQVLSLFLAEQNVIRDRLREQLGKISSHEDLLADIIITAIHQYETRQYIWPDEKYSLVLMSAFCYHLLDTTNNPSQPSSNSTSGSAASNATSSATKVSARKRIPHSKLDKMLKECQVIRLFGDMSVCPFNYVKQSASYDPSKWSECCNLNKLSSQGVLLDHMTRFRDEYNSLTVELAFYTNFVTTRGSACDAASIRPTMDNRQLYNLMLRALQLLSGWTVQILDTYTWKLAHCTDCHQNPTCPETAEDYEKAVRYNYSAGEMGALVEIIGMVKCVQNQLSKLDVSYSEAIRRHIYSELQLLASTTLSEPFRKATKNKKSVAAWLLDSVRRACTDMAPPQSAQTAPLRDVGPSSTQLYLVRTTLESLVANKSMAGHKNSLRKDLDSPSIASLELFLRNSFPWPYLLNLQDTVAKCCDMSQFWFREFFLELSNGAHIQFPIEMSLPWILTEHILNAGTLPSSTTTTGGTCSSVLSASMATSTTGLDLLLYPLDLYNDAAHCSLVTFRRKYLYDECEAEANLAFDQLVFKLAQQLYRYYKQLAAGALLMDKAFQARTGCVNPTTAPALCRQQRRHYQLLIRQRCVHLLGRSIDLNRLLTQRINKSLLTSLEVAISRFRSSDITGVIELEQLIEVNRCTHALLVEAGLELDPFPGLVDEANLCVKSHLGAIAQHVFWEVNYDLSPNYCYNDSTGGRFVPTVVPFGQQLLRDDPPNEAAPEHAWGSRHLNHVGSLLYRQICSRHVGPQHLAAVARLLGYQGVYVVVAELMKICESMIRTNLRAIVQRISALMPQQLAPPRSQDGAQVTSDQLFSYYYKQLMGIYQMSSLSTDVCQAFREFGNIILFIHLLEQNLTVQESIDLKHAAPFTGLLPRPFNPAGDSANSPLCEQQHRDVIKKMEYKYAVLHVSKIVSKLGTPQQAQLVREHEILTKERLCCGLVMFEQVLRQLQEYLGGNTGPTAMTHSNGGSHTAPTNDVWHGVAPANEVMEVVECSQFHRIWSAIQFVFSTPRGNNEFNVEELFGEGLHWAGCTLICLLGQQRRFEALDIGHHLMRAQRSDKRTECHENVSLERLAQRIRRFNILNSQIFASLNRYLYPVDRYVALCESVRNFPTPMYQVPPTSTTSTNN